MPISPLLLSNLHQHNIGSLLQTHGYLLLLLDDLPDNHMRDMHTWHTTLSQAFKLPQTTKDNLCPFMSYNGCTMGYRKDGLREFIETRVDAEGSLQPAVPVPGYTQRVLSLWEILRSIGTRVMTCMASTMGIDAEYFLDLIDRSEMDSGELSSSVMRICSYPHQHDAEGEDCSTKIAFGSHTDVSLLTVAPCSSVAGLEVRDLSDGSWVSVEEGQKNSEGYPMVVVFVGDIMQLLTRSFYRATVHRVVTHSISLDNVRDVPVRVSCPFIIRGRHRTLIPPLRIYSRWAPTSCPQQQSSDGIIELPDLEGTSMKVVHKLLDLKRQKCAREHEDEDGDWVLCAFNQESSSETPEHDP